MNQKPLKIKNNKKKRESATEPNVKETVVQPFQLPSIETEVQKGHRTGEGQLGT